MRFLNIFGTDPTTGQTTDQSNSGAAAPAVSGASGVAAFFQAHIKSIALVVLGLGSLWHWAADKGRYKRKRKNFKWAGIASIVAGVGLFITKKG